MTTEHKRFPVAAAAIAGTLENFATFPFEYVKTQLQLQIRSSALYAGSSAYTGPLDVVQRTFRTAGLLGLYSGGASFVIFSPLRAVVRFTTFERLRITARSQQLRETPGGKRLSDLGCGVLAGAADGALCQTPSNAIAVKMVHDQSPRGPRQYRLGGGPSWHAKSGIRRQTAPPHATAGTCSTLRVRLRPSLASGARPSPPAARGERCDSRPCEYRHGFFSGLWPTVAKVSFCAGVRPRRRGWRLEAVSPRQSSH